MNHYPSNITSISFHSCKAFNMPGTRAMCWTYINSFISHNDPVEWASSFSVEETCCTWAVRLHWVVPPGSSSHLHNAWNSVSLHPSLAKQRIKDFGVIQSSVWILTPLLAVWFLVCFWTSLNFSSFLCRMEVIPFPCQVAMGAKWINENVWHNEVSQVKLLSSLPCTLFLYHSLSPLPPGSLCLLSYALFFSCASPEKGLY